jgi:hypothetical protein
MAEGDVEDDVAGTCLPNPEATVSMVVPEEGAKLVSPL